MYPLIGWLAQMTDWVVFQAGSFHMIGFQFARGWDCLRGLQSLPFCPWASLGLSYLLITRVIATPSCQKSLFCTAALFHYISLWLTSPFLQTLVMSISLFFCSQLFEPCSLSSDGLYLFPIPSVGNRYKPFEERLVNIPLPSADYNQ